MKRENLTDGDFHRVTSKRNRDLLIWQRGANTPQPLLIVSFQNNRIRRREVDMGRCGCIPLRQLGTCHWT